MTDDQAQYLSQDKLKSLQDELEDLKENKIPLIAKRIDEAKQMGDLSENAEYHAARDEMAWAQTRVKELEMIIKDAEVIDDDQTGHDSVTIGSTVRIKSGKVERDFTIVGAQEADPISGKISNESPLGKSLLGARRGDEVEVEVPAGMQIYEVIDVK